MSLLSAHRAGFPAGFTAVTALSDESGIALGVLKLAAGETLREPPEHETAWLLLGGSLDTSAEGHGARLERRSLFDGAPAALHVSAGTPVELAAREPCELLVCSAANPTRFPARH